MKWLVTDTLGGDGDALGNYVRWLGGAGIKPEIIKPPAAPPDPGPFAALLLTGGVDVDPALYGEAQARQTRKIDRARDDLEIELIRGFLHAGRPVFGICRGIQVLNVALGGKLIQHLPEVTTEEHRAKAEKDARHGLRVAEGAHLARALAGVTEVNSSHHQAADPTAIARRLVVSAVSPGGVVEALEGSWLPAPVVAVQWHPERLEPADSPAAAGLLKWWRDLAART